MVKLPIADALRLFSGEVGAVVIPAVGLGSAEIAISRGDFIPSVDNYVQKILILARRYFAGEKDLWI